MKKLLSLLLVIILGLSLFGCGTNARAMTDEELDAYIESRTKEYKVLSVYQYMDIETNHFGGVLDKSLKYCFTYIGDDGQLHEFDDFEHTEYGLWKIQIGNENKYVVRDLGLDIYRWLILTEETLTNMTVVQ